MHRRTIAKIPSQQKLEKRGVSYRRYASWFSQAFAWSSALVGVSALFVVLMGYRGSLRLSDIPRPNVGPGFSESATQAFGSLWIGGWMALIALFLSLVALIHSKRRLRTLLFSLPAMLCVVVILMHPRWLFAALSYGL